ncbi:lysine-specific demethylase 7A isoform X2 [Alosa sapidissima]|uniref:lysine-specific demethylase 7A isoform X2 n=1 Tax=Alosa sapidissima TaxID=34773 RepID=UPI001C087BC6|nr:lysine-specific demethylase 7A isoform X2 [Alosa sapidissima]
MAAAPLYCVCRQPYDVSRFMIECDICKDWFHGSCVQVEEHHAADIDVYHCPNCDVQHGPSLMKKRNNWHRHDYTEPGDGTKPVQAGTSVFVRELQERSFPSADEIVLKMQGHHVTPKYLEKHGFNHPIMLPEFEGLGLKLPPPSFSVKDVEECVGGDKVIDVIDVARQADSKMKLKEFVKYYYQPQRPKVLNVISLEFSDTKMSDLVVVPDVAQKMSWVENYWPDDSFFPKPFVQKYCLMGVKDSYTDFHIDFGGTSVWYHVLWGEKIFYLIEPTKANLALYEAWSSSVNQSEVFFGEKVEKCYKCVVRQGTTILIPTGWIHAVLTSQDSMAFGGNFLHNLNIGMQLRCYEMERRLKTPDLFKFPYFEAICWYVAKNLLETLRELREDNCPPQAYLVEGVKALISALKTWLKREVTEPTSEVPDHIRPHHLVKELTKEIRYLEEDQGSGGGHKPMKTQGNGGCPLTRSTLERGCHARRAARRLREQQQQQQHQQQHTPKLSSNLDVLERHTREVLKRLEVGPLEEDPDFSTRVHGKFNKVSMASAVTIEKGLDNNLHLVMCNGRIVRDQRPRGLMKTSVKTENGNMLAYQLKQVKTERIDSDEEQHCSRDSHTNTQPELRGETSGVSDTESEDSGSTERRDSSSEDDSGSSEDEKDDVKGSMEDSGSVMGHQANTKHNHKHRPLKRERPTSPSTEEAIQGMLSMAGLLCPQRPDEDGNSQEPWWSRTVHLSPEHRDRQPPSGPESKVFMDSQGNSSSEAWDHHEIPPSPLRQEDSPRGDFQYRESSMSPPLHPSKRHASNPPPISNQATKGKRPKKGMATAKQRLGKILKLNRHNRLFV